MDARAHIRKGSGKETSGPAPIINIHYCGVVSFHRSLRISLEKSAYNNCSASIL